MAEYLVRSESLASVADAIRAKGGTTEALSFPDGFVSAVGRISAGGGDANAIARSILDGSITEYTDNEITTLRPAAFRACKQLKNYNAPNVKTIDDRAFRDCTSLVEINFPNLTSLLGKDHFNGCTSLVTANFPVLKGLWGYDNIFAGCVALKYVNLSSITSLSTAFFGCSALEELSLPSMNGGVATGCFSNCTSLKKVDFGNMADFARTNAFQNCTSLEAVIIRGGSVSSLSNVNNFSTSGIGLGTGYIYVPSALVDSYKSATNWSTYASQIRAIEDYPEICGEVTA